MRPKEVEPPEKPTKEVRIVKIQFKNESPLPRDVVRELSFGLRSHPIFWAEFSDSEDYLKEMGEVGVRGVLQDNGYFKARGDVRLSNLLEKRDHYEIGLKVWTDSGPRYRVGDVRFVEAEADPFHFSQTFLRSLFHLKHGQIFGSGELRDTIKRITAAYGEDGFIDETAEPDFRFNEAAHLIDLTLRIDQQKQYRVGSITILGPSERVQRRLLQTLPAPGEPMNTKKLHDFFKVNRGLLPPDASEQQDVEITRNTKNRLVTIVMDFFTCPSGQFQSSSKKD